MDRGDGDAMAMAHGTAEQRGPGGTDEQPRDAFAAEGGHVRGGRRLRLLPTRASLAERRERCDSRRRHAARHAERTEAAAVAAAAAAAAAARFAMAFFHGLRPSECSCPGRLGLPLPYPCSPPVPFHPGIPLRQPPPLCLSTLMHTYTNISGSSPDATCLAGRRWGEKFHG
ncbi:hypothetical protein LX32DRAFT_261137 [Colletotrichum zoysiae]|uniref:Uncharacterized protein n=1 Tax=Colletotrichum zoysiae TaxID=1216348 RepID=A0AAD9H4F4_9PEZI|nr:hypothetical protein LX32DRAFT_261137 [Colletotrichum zoysiae]